MRNALALNRMFTKGFRDDFPVEAAKYGLRVDNSAKDAPMLKIEVHVMQMNCAAFGCASSFTMLGYLGEPASPALWSFTSRVGQPLVNADIDVSIFESFQKSLLNAMKTDGVIAVRSDGGK